MVKIAYFVIQPSGNNNCQREPPGKQYEVTNVGSELVDIELNEGINLCEDMSFICQRWVDTKRIRASYFHSEIM